MTDIEGSCHCGAIKLRVVGGFGEGARAGICHCNSCQTLAGSLFAYIAFVPRDKLLILQGEPKGYKQPIDAAASGKQVIRYFCGDCGTPLWAAAESAPHAYTVKLALFGNNIPPGNEIYWKYAQPWEKPLASPDNVFEGWPHS
ncbi:hypothetical protein FOMPIDRAFT_1021436 [Fomitopsis schrenkii]|uniref:CENP-V/GFA domain-containing protein n=1 Tax=Fomitopsis schrenkii TaxID=2126942 RepID=S8ENW4_FOMSC|nr:hypothetical protein FOMPIDRAFT_1021436 [Fomitopsis schrenkii]